MVMPLGSSILGENPEDDIILSELRRSGTEGRPATVPNRQDLGLGARGAGGASDFLQRLSLALGDIGAGFKGKSPSEFPSRVAGREKRGEAESRAKMLPVLLNTAKIFQEIGLSEEQIPLAAQKLSESATQLGMDLKPELFVDALKIPDSDKVLRRLLADPKFVGGLIEDQRKRLKDEADQVESRRKFALEQGYTTEQAEQYATSGKLPGGLTPKAGQAAESAKVLNEAREASTAASKSLAAARSGTKPPTFNELTLMIQRLAKTRENLEFSVGIPEEERKALIENIDKSIAAVGGMLNTISERRSGGKAEKPTEKPGPEASTAAPKGLPVAKDNKGKTFRDTETGKRWRSDGAQWIEAK